MLINFIIFTVIFLNKLIQFLIEFNDISVVIRLLAAAIMGGLIGSERGRHGRAAGLRTHILVCVGATMTSLTSLFLNDVLGSQGDLARLSAQVISGIGFLGAGTILIRNSSVITGLTTAAGMWATAAIGVAIGYGFYSGAVTATVISIFSVTVLSRLERKRKNLNNVYIELSDISDTEQAINILRDSEDLMVSYDIVPAKSGHSANVGIMCMIKGSEHYVLLKKELCDKCNIAIMIGDINI